jgi:hypothetical protein
LRMQERDDTERRVAHNCEWGHILASLGDNLRGFDDISGHRGFQPHFGANRPPNRTSDHGANLLCMSNGCTDCKWDQVFAHICGIPWGYAEPHQQLLQHLHFGASRCE